MAVTIKINPCPDATVTVNDSAYDTVPSGGSLDVDVVDQGDNPVGSLSGGKWVVSGTGIAYRRPQWSGQSVSFFSFDEADNRTNGVYDYTPPVLPEKVAQLATFTTLTENNAFGNTNRFTDENGLQVYGNNYAIDHYTGLGWALTQIGTDTAANLATTAQSQTVNGFSDFRLASLPEMLSLLDQSQALNGAFDYAPFNYDMGVSGLLWTCSVRSDGSPFRMQGANNFSGSSGNYLGFIARNHYT